MPGLVKNITLRQWFCARVLEDWRLYLGPTVRRAYRAETDEERVTELKEMRRQFRAYVKLINEILKPDAPISTPIISRSSPEPNT